MYVINNVPLTSLSSSMISKIFRNSSCLVTRSLRVRGGELREEEEGERGGEEAEEGDEVVILEEEVAGEEEWPRARLMVREIVFWKE